MEPTKPTFAATNQLEKAQHEKLLRKLTKDLGEAKKAGKAEEVAALEAQIKGLGSDDVVTSAAIKEIAKGANYAKGDVTAALERFDGDKDGLYSDDEFDQIMEASKPKGPAPTGSTNAVTETKAPKPKDPAAEKIGVVLNDSVWDMPSGEELKAAGVTGARITLKNDNYPKDLAEWKRKLAEYKANGVEVTLQLGKELPKTDVPPQKIGPDKKIGDQGPAWDKQFDAWMQNQYLPAVKGVMDELGESVDVVEAFNETDEPNNRRKEEGADDTYVPGLPAKKFGEAMKATYEAVHNHPKAKDRPPEQKIKVITGGLDSGQPGYLQDAADATKDAQGRPTLYADGIGLHPYDKDPDGRYPDQPVETERSLQRILGQYANLGLNTPNGGNPPIYITEASQPVRSDAAGFNAAFARETGSVDAVTRSYFFYRDTGDRHPGMVGADNQPTDAYRALTEVTGGEAPKSKPPPRQK